MAPDSQVETYAAVRLHLDSWRWTGVPFLIRAGKCLPMDATEVFIRLKASPCENRFLTATTSGLGWVLIFR